MTVSEEIIKLYLSGYTPSDIVKMGYPKSTVYTVLRKMEKRLSEFQKMVLDLMADADCLIYDEIIICRREVFKKIIGLINSWVAW